MRQLVKNQFGNMAKKAPKSRLEDPAIFIACSGLGMGNASRMIAVAEEMISLASQQGLKLRVHIASWGSGYKFLKQSQNHRDLEFELHQLEAYPAQLSQLVFKGFSTFCRNSFLIRRWLWKIRPTLILLDSDYHFPAFLGSDCPVFFMGQAADVLKRAKRCSYSPDSWKEIINLNLRERLDFFFQRCVAKSVIVPSFRVTANTDAKIHHIPLVVRREFLCPTQPQSTSLRIGILLSGSRLEKDHFVNFAKRHHLKILSPDDLHPNTTVPSRAEMLDRFDLLFIQGGLSSISECIARGKFVVVFPMQGHPEQILNAVEVEQLGLGIKANVDDLSNLTQILDRAESARRRSRRFLVKCDGAHVAALTLLGQVAPPETT